MGKPTANFGGSGIDLRSSSTQCLYCVLHAVERHQGTISEAKGLSHLNVCGVFYTHLRDTRAR